MLTEHVNYSLSTKLDYGKSGSGQDQGSAGRVIAVGKAAIEGAGPGRFRRGVREWPRVELDYEQNEVGAAPADWKELEGGQKPRCR